MTRLNLTAMACACIALCAAAQEPVAPNGPEARALEPKEQAERPGPLEGDTELAAYLGVSTAPADETLARQLGLPQGTGLTVYYVDPKSPAAESLKVHDVFVKLNDQILVNTDQFAVLVRTFKPGEKINLEIRRDGKPVTVTAALAEKEMPQLGRRRIRWPDVRFDAPFINRFFPAQMAEELIDKITDTVNELGNEIKVEAGKLDGILKSIRDDINEAGALDKKDELVERMTNQLKAWGREIGAEGDRIAELIKNVETHVAESGRDFRQRGPRSESLRNRLQRGQRTPEKPQTRIVSVSQDGGSFSDQNHSLTVTKTDKGLVLKAQDNKGAVLFDGPVDSDDQMNRIPEDIREKAEELKWRIKTQPQPEKKKDSI